jgi:hypothetical protein
MEEVAGMTLTPEVIAAGYEFLRATLPFKRWKLPHADNVKFIVSAEKRLYAQYRWDGKQHTIALSMYAIGHTLTLLIYLSHEMIHMYLEENGWETRNHETDTHNAKFKKLAASACKTHGWDLKAFY